MSLASLGTGCRLPAQFPSEGQVFVDRLESEWNALLVVLQGGRSPFAARKGAKPKVSKSPVPMASDEALTARNAELLQEMFKVIYVRDFQNPREFADYVDTLNQGASIEGLYNGFTRSSTYRKLEMARIPVSPQAVVVFSEELARLELALPVSQRTVFEAASALPLARPVQLGESGNSAGGPESAPGELVFGTDPKAVVSNAPRSALPEPAAGAQATLEVLARDYQERFKAASIFTLKRILGEEAMKVIASKVSDPGGLAAWYGKWVAEVCGVRKVDFGLELRSRPDAAFHEAWAKGSTEDRLRWEVLNRLHRILNEAGRK